MNQDEIRLVLKDEARRCAYKVWNIDERENFRVEDIVFSDFEEKYDDYSHIWSSHVEQFFKEFIGSILKKNNVIKEDEDFTTVFGVYVGLGMKPPRKYVTLEIIKRIDDCHIERQIPETNILDIIEGKISDKFLEFLGFRNNGITFDDFEDKRNEKLFKYLSEHTDEILIMNPDDKHRNTYARIIEMPNNINGIVKYRYVAVEAFYGYSLESSTITDAKIKNIVIITEEKECILDDLFKRGFTLRIPGSVIYDVNSYILSVLNAKEKVPERLSISIDEYLTKTYNEECSE